MRICSSCQLVKQEFHFRMLKNAKELIPEIISQLICRDCQKAKIDIAKIKPNVVKIEEKAHTISFN